MNDVAGHPDPPCDLDIVGEVPLVNNMTAAEKFGIYQTLRAAFQDGTLRHGAIREIANQFHVCEKFVSRIWVRGGRGALCIQAVFADRRAGYRKPLKYQKDEMHDLLRQVPVEARSTIRDSAAAIGIPKSTFHRYTRVQKFFRPASIQMKPALTGTHCTRRLRFVRDMVNEETGLYWEQYDTIHIDEKWFFIDKVNRRCYLNDDEVAPIKQTKNKQYMEKVMFLCAVARPRKAINQRQQQLQNDNNDDEIWDFDGKVGVWPFVEWYEAARTSRNRPRGAPLCRNVSVNAETFQKMILEELLPRIRDSCPVAMRGRVIRIQLDNATPHRAINHEAFYLKAAELQLNCRLIYQPSQSPDMNICDLAFFASIQSLYHKKVGIKTNVDLIDAVEEAFAEYNPQKLDHAFLSLMMNYNCVIQHEGSNKYTTPHMGKQRLERAGLLPTTIRAVDFAGNVPDYGYINEDEVIAELENLANDEFDE
jgi:hypothetical protein